MLETSTPLYAEVQQTMTAGGKFGTRCDPESPSVGLYPPGSNMPTNHRFTGIHVLSKAAGHPGGGARAAGAQVHGELPLWGAQRHAGRPVNVRLGGLGLLALARDAQSVNEVSGIIYNQALQPAALHLETSLAVNPSTV